MAEKYIRSNDDDLYSMIWSQFNMRISLIEPLYISDSSDSSRPMPPEVVKYFQRSQTHDTAPTPVMRIPSKYKSWVLDRCENMEVSKLLDSKDRVILRNLSKKPVSKIVEILHIDTCNSRELYKKAGFNSEEKARAQGLLKNEFRARCKSNGGILHTWNGDGGFAFFDSDRYFGKSVKPAKLFLKNLDNLNAQSSMAVGKNLTRCVRIAAHRGEICTSSDPSIDSAKAKFFDDFLKNEKKFAPLENQLFITTQLYEALPVKEKKNFHPFEDITADSLITTIYSLKSIEPVERLKPVKDIKQKPGKRDILQINEDKLVQPTPVEWDYLRNRIVNNHTNVAARNEITKGLIQLLNQGNKKKYPITSKDLREITLSALYNYLRITFDSILFRISYWSSIQEAGGNYLKLVAYRYPIEVKPSNPDRKLRIEDPYQLCHSFITSIPLATPDVEKARRAGQWIDFSDSQKQKKRDLRSALQIPVYYRDPDGEKFMQGVLCMDTNIPDTFWNEETALWKDDLVGYLVNISLSENLRKCGF